MAALGKAELIEKIREHNDDAAVLMLRSLTVKQLKGYLHELDEYDKVKDYWEEKQS